MIINKLKVKKILVKKILGFIFKSKTKTNLQKLLRLSEDSRKFNHSSNTTSKVSQSNIPISSEFFPQKNKFDESYVFSISNALAISSPSIIFPKPDQYLIEHLDYKNIDIDQLSQSFYSQGIKQLLWSVLNQETMIQGNVLLLDFTKATTYFHWVMDGLTKIALFMRLFPEITDLKVICPLSKLSWQLESLESLGLTQEQLIFLDQGKVRIEKLWIADYIRNYPQLYPNDIVSILKEKIVTNLQLENIQQKVIPYIYIKRKAKAGRAVVNEEELMRCLFKYGFVDYFLEDMKFQDQVKLFSQAKIVVAPHGAGLTNLIFCEETTKIIELFGNYLNPVFYKIATAKGMEYSLLQGKDAEDKTGVDNRRNNFYINVSDLEKVLNKVID